MVSPFYLGSNPADDAKGQYPGKPISGGSNRFTPPPEFVDLTGDFEMLWEKAVGGMTAATIGLPEKYLAEQKAAWRSLFVVTGGFDDTYSESDPYMRELSGEAEQYYKATDFKIDLVKVFTDPKSQLKDIWEATINREDLSREARDRLLSAVLFGEGVAAAGTGLQGTLLNASIKSFETRYDAMQERAGVARVGGGSFPLNLIDASSKPVYHVDQEDTISGIQRPSYKDSRVEYGKAFIEWNRKADGQSNYSDYRKLIRQTGISMDDIFRSSTGSVYLPVGVAPTAATGGARVVPSKLIDQTLTTSLGLAPGTTAYDDAKAELEESYKRFEAMHAANDKISTFFAFRGANFNATKAISTLESSRVVPGIPGVPLDIGSIAIKEEVDKARADLRKVAKPLAEMAVQVQELEDLYKSTAGMSAHEIRRVENWAKKTNAEITKLASSVDKNMTAEELVRLSRSGSSTALDAFADAWGSAADDVSVRRRAARGLSNFSFSLSGANVMQPGLQTELAHMFVDHHLLPGRDAGTTSVASILSQTVFGKQLQMYSLSARDTYKFNYVSNLVTTLEKNKVVSTLLKSRVINALPQYTPKNVVRNFLTSNHYFGLKVDEFTMKDYIAWAEGGRVGNFSIFKRPGSAFVYKMSKSNTFGKLFKNSFTIDLGGIGKFATAGGIHFEAVTALNAFRSEGGKQNLKMILNNSVPFTPAFAGHHEMLAKLAKLRHDHKLNQHDAFIALLLSTEDKDEFEKLFGLFPFGAHDKVYAQLAEFRKWLRDNKFDVFDPVTGAFDYSKFANMEKLLSWFHDRKINPAFYSYTASTIGLIQRLTQNLNAIQEKIFAKKLFGKITVGKVFGWQAQASTFLTNRAMGLLTRIGSKLAATFLTGAVAAGTGGLGTFLKPVIEKAIYFISVKVVGKFSHMMSDLLHGNFSAIGYALQNSIVFLFKIVAYVILIIGFIIIGPVVFLNFLVSNMSPKAPYPYNNISAGRPVTLISGGDVVPGACSNKCLTQGGFTTTSPSYKGIETQGHGSNSYWNYVENVLSLPTCDYAMPELNYGGGFRPTATLDNADAEENRCISEKPFMAESNFYGMAWDVAAAGGAPTAGQVICAPALGTVSYWVAGTATTIPGKGARIELNGFDASDTLIYKLKFLHLDINSVVRKDERVLPGDGIAKVWDWGNNSHAHLELMNTVTGNPMAPEDSGICL
jgi:hypothetical protein